MKTHEILRSTESAYERKVFEMYWRWCQVQSADDNELQTVVANAAMNRWFLDNLARVESEFEEDVMPYIVSATNEALSQLWLKHAMKLLLYYPKPLLNERSNTIIGQ